MTAAEKLAALRAEMARANLDGFIVPRADEHLGEYVPACAERLAWLTGFTGSAGLAIVLRDRAAVFTDGRYTLQLEAETDAALWERHHIIDDPPQPWLARMAGAAARIGYDPLLLSEDGLARFADAGAALVACGNLVDAIWHDRPPPPDAPAVPHPLEYAGVASAEKRAQIAESLEAANADAAVLSDPASIAWLLNVRGADIPFTPYALAFAIARADGNADLFIAPHKLPDETRAWIGNAVTVHDRAALPDALASWRGRRVLVDRAGTPVWFAQTLRDAGAETVAGADPCLLPKACKNTTEQQGARAAHARDAVALCRFLHAMQRPDGHTERTAAALLLGLRRDLPHFRGESFPAISGAGEHGAIIHYRVSEASDRPIRPDEIYLIDSGAQYLDGTTDVTRALWTGAAAPPAALRDRYTRVLKGHIAIATLVFPHGVSGAHLDAFARRALWQEGLDYDHGTGHGVGSYLSVHEGPAAISRAAKPVPIAAGMILSNEPGYYEPGGYGIRLENLVLARPEPRTNAHKPFLGFETLTLAPFDRRLIEPALLAPEERAWLDAYHARVLHAVGPALPPDAASWLAEACAKL